MQPATIKLFLIDGEPSGIRTAEISNWTGKAVAGPRSRLDDIRLRTELTSPGVYFLTGVDAETDRSTLYIGEAESVSKRLKQQHQSDKEWSQLVAFISKDENLTKSHIRYLEDELIVRAQQAKQVLLVNSSRSGSSLPESDQAEMNVFLDKMLQLLPILGVDAFKTLSVRNLNESEDNQDTLHCSIKGLQATGRLSDNGLIVFEGSQAVKEDRQSSIRIRAKREQYIENGVLEVREGNLVFTQDFEFTSPSAAAAIIRGGSTNGLKAWKNHKGISLKDLD
jgi:hypothetical protein